MKRIQFALCTCAIMILGIALFAQQPKWEHATFHVSGNCGMCKKSIEAALHTDGVEAALWNPDTKKLRVKYNPAQITLVQIHQRVSDAGYDTDSQKANDSTYAHLAQCCHYRDAKCTHDAK